MQEGIFDEFSKAVVEKVNKFKMGGGMDPNTTLGPLISQGAVDRVCSPQHTMTDLLQHSHVAYQHGTAAGGIEGEEGTVIMLHSMSPSCIHGAMARQ